MQKIQSRIFNYGDEKESSWPPKYGTKEKGVFYWDRETKSFKKGVPPSNVKNFAKAPYIITDNIDPYYHPAAEQWTDSKAKLRDLDKATGCITTDKHIPPDPSLAKQREKARIRDNHEALHKAVAQIDAGTAPLTEETRALCNATNERVSNALGMDAFNAAGRKNNPRGKRYRK